MPEDDQISLFSKEAHVSVEKASLCILDSEACVYEGSRRFSLP